MDRRELLKMITVLTGGAMIGGELLISGCKSESARALSFTPENIALLDEVGDTIIPTTTSPGAKAARIGEFMQRIVTDCYEKEDQDTFYEGFDKLDKACKKETGKNFIDATPEERKTFLIALDKEAKEYQKKKSKFDSDEKIKKAEQRGTGQPDYVVQKMPSHYFTMMKQLTLWGYFTSKEGMTKALNYLPVPGKFLGCIDYKKGDKVQVGLGG